MSQQASMVPIMPHITLAPVAMQNPALMLPTRLVKAPPTALLMARPPSPPQEEDELPELADDFDEWMNEVPQQSVEISARQIPHSLPLDQLADHTNTAAAASTQLDSSMSFQPLPSPSARRQEDTLPTQPTRSGGSKTGSTQHTPRSARASVTSLSRHKTFDGADPTPLPGSVMPAEASAQPSPSGSPVLSSMQQRTPRSMAALPSPPAVANKYLVLNGSQPVSTAPYAALPSPPSQMSPSADALAINTVLSPTIQLLVPPDDSPPPLEAEQLSTAMDSSQALPIHSDDYTASYHQSPHHQIVSPSQLQFGSMSHLVRMPHVHTRGPSSPATVTGTFKQSPAASPTHMHARRTSFNPLSISSHQPYLQYAAAPPVPSPASSDDEGDDDAELTTQHTFSTHGAAHGRTLSRTRPPPPGASSLAGRP